MSSKLRRNSFEFASGEDDCEHTGGAACADGDYTEVAASMSKLRIAKQPLYTEAEPEEPQMEDIIPQMSAVAAPFKPGACLNRGVLNAHGFYETEVNLRLCASLQDLADWEQSKGKEGKQPTLSIKDKNRCFEMPGAPSGAPRTAMHAQGNIYLTEVRSTFPCSLMFKMNARLRGSSVAQCCSDTGEKGAHLAYPMQHKAWDDNPQLLVESELGKMTEDYVSSYPSFLNGKAFVDAVEDVTNNPKVCLVDINSPIVDMVNSARQGKGIDELTPDDSAMQMGKLIIDKVEVHEAIKSLNSCLDDDVNYVKLYQAMKINLSRPFFDRTQGNKGESAWLDTEELDVKSKQKADNEAALTKKYSIHVRAIVEHRPHITAKDEKKV